MAVVCQTCGDEPALETRDTLLRRTGGLTFSVSLKETLRCRCVSFLSGKGSRGTNRLAISNASCYEKSGQWLFRIGNYRKKNVFKKGRQSSFYRGQQGKGRVGGQVGNGEEP